MKKIMFNDRYGLTKAVLEGRKTMTRRIAKFNEKPCPISGCLYCQHRDHDKGCEWILEHCKYKPGDIVAVAQNLRDMGYNPRDTRHRSGAIWGLDHTPAWSNKMLVSASECKRRIRITNVRVERLQDISDEDCIKEGVQQQLIDIFTFDGWRFFTHTARDAFAALIDKVSGNGTWESNPWVFVYEFELMEE